MYFKYYCRSYSINTPYYARTQFNLHKQFIVYSELKINKTIMFFDKFNAKISIHVKYFDYTIPEIFEKHQIPIFTKFIYVLKYLNTSSTIVEIII